MTEESQKAYLSSWNEILRPREGMSFNLNVVWGTSVINSPPHVKEGTDLRSVQRANQGWLSGGNWLSVTFFQIKAPSLTTPAPLRFAPLRLPSL